MVRRIYIILCFVIVFGSSAFSNTIADSLITEFNNYLEKKKHTDTLYIIANEIGNQLAKENINKAFEFAFYVQKLGAERSNDTLRNIAYISLAYLYRSQGMLDKTLEFALKSNEEVKYSDSGALAWNHVLIGNIYYEKQLYPKAKEYYYDAYKIFEEFYGRMYNLDSLMKDYFYHSLAVCLNNIGLCYIKQTKIDSAEIFFRKATDFRSVTENHLGNAYQYYYLSRIDFYNKNYDSLKLKMKKAIDILHDPKDKNLLNLYNYQTALGDFYSFLYEVYFDLNDANMFGNYADKAIKYYDIANNNVDKLRFMLMMAKNYLKTNNTNKTIDLSHYIILKSENYKFFKIKQSAIELLAQCYLQMGYKNKAIDILHWESAYEDSLRFVQDSIQFAWIEKNIKNEQLANTIEDIKTKEVINKEKIKNQNNYIIILIISTVLTLLIASFLFIIFISKNKSNKVLHLKNSELNKINSLLEESREKLSFNLTKLSKSEKELKEAVTTKDKFFSIIAHDLKSPLSSITNSLDLLNISYKTFSDKEKHEFIELLSDSSKNIMELLENLLMWSRTQNGKIKFNPENADISKIGESVFSILEENAKAKEISLINQIPEQTYVYIDPNMINTIFRNLIANSIKFTPNNGSITLNIEEKPDHFIFFVQDTGVGIKKERINDLFRIDKNNSTLGTNNEKGTGLGLIICKEFVEYHKGNIWVESELGNWTKFSFTIPKKSY